MRGTVAIQAVLENFDTLQTTELSASDTAHARTGCARGAEPRSSRSLAAALLLSTFALFLHIQSAKNSGDFLFNTAHVLHGDLEVESESLGEVFTSICGESSLGLRAISESIRSELPEFLFLPILPAGASSRMKYLARFFRAPPAR